MLEFWEMTMESKTARDFLDEVVRERSKTNPRFGEMVEAALDQRRLLRELAKVREKTGVSQTMVAARMGTSQSAVARLETGEADIRLSTLARYAAAVGTKLSWSLVPVRRTKVSSAR